MPARRARVSAGVVPSRSVTFGAGPIEASASRHEPGCRRGERAEPYRPGRGVLAGRLAAGGVELVQDPDGAGEKPSSGGGEDHAVPAALEQPAARDRLERRHLP